jgi:hypothetical protein
MLQSKWMSLLDSLILQMILTTLKRGRQIGSKDKNPQIRNRTKKKDDPSMDMKISKEYLT